MKKKVILFNPRSADSKHRIPNSVLALAAAVEGRWEWRIVDGNREKDPLQAIQALLETGEYGYFGCTIMPGPQLKQGIPITKKVKALFPDVVTVMGGYFASNQWQSVIESEFVDFVVYGPGDRAFPELLDALENERPLDTVDNLIYTNAEGVPAQNRKAPIYDQDELPGLPYDKLHRQYSFKGYLGKTFLGDKTVAYHSSMGCPFTCSFCAVVPIYKARWKGKSAENVYRDIKYLKDVHGADAIEFHDNNFFVSEKRTNEFSRLVMNDNMNWWGEGRIDTLDRYSDDSLALMRESGCRMIFFGAETGNDEVLKKMNKGGTQSSEQIKRFAARMAEFDIIPEYSFVLGTPADTEEEVMKQIDGDINFIKEIKRINPATEIIIYIYSPVPTEGSDMYEQVKELGFHFPEKLEDWLDPVWLNFDLRRNPLTPWLTPEMVDKIRNFETVLNGYYPTVSDIKLTGMKRKVIRSVASWRYRNDWFHFPYEIKALQKFWLKYRQPEVEGF